MQKEIKQSLLAQQLQRQTPKQPSPSPNALRQPPSSEHVCEPNEEGILYQQKKKQILILIVGFQALGLCVFGYQVFVWQVWEQYFFQTGQYVVSVQ